MKLAFIGTGYVGLVTGACMAEMGHEVICADIDKKKIAMLSKGVMPIYELGLEELVRKHVKKNRLSFTTSVAKAIKSADVVFSAVGTPEDKKTGQADLQYVYAVAKEFGKNLGKEYKILVNKSTVPVGTAEAVHAIVEKASGGKKEFDIVSNPEFLREGAAIKDFLNPDRVVIGADSDRARVVMGKIYRPLQRAQRPVVFTDVKSAEIIKYASNSFLATKISFINEMANFCERVGGNVKEVAKGMGFDKRIGSQFLYAGIGYGGSCFPKDVKALIHTAKEHGQQLHILESVDEVNTAQKLRPVELLKKHFKSLKGKTIAVWGIAFKPRTDDIREAPALVVMEALVKAGAKIQAFDPVAIENARETFRKKEVMYAADAEEAVRGADALLILTEWDEFRTPDLGQIGSLMNGKVIVDGRNVLERREAEDAGFIYFGIGV